MPRPVAPGRDDLGACGVVVERRQRGQVLGRVADHLAVRRDEGDPCGRECADLVRLLVEGLDGAVGAALQEQRRRQPRLGHEVALDRPQQLGANRHRDEHRHEDQGHRRDAEDRQERAPAEAAEAHGRCAPLRVHEAVAELLDGLDGLAERRDLLAQPPHVHVDGPRAAGVAVAPDIREQEVPREHAPAVLHQVLEQQEFLGGQPHRLAAVGDDVALAVEFDGPVDHRGAPGLRPALRAPQQGADPGHELARAERLRDVVVGAELEAHDPVGLLGAGGQHDDGQRARLGRPAEGAADLQAVDAGQHEVEDDEVRHAGADEGEGLAAVAERVGDVAGPRQVALEQFGDVAVVFDNEDVAHEAGRLDPSPAARMPVQRVAVTCRVTSTAGGACPGGRFLIRFGRLGAKGSRTWRNSG